MPGKLEIVCVVDDDAAVRNALKFLLEVEGMTVRTYDGPAALLADRTLPPRACFAVDQQMPVMDGLELLSVLRERGATGPAILITGESNDRLRMRAQKLGVHRVLEKPLQDGAFVDSVRSALKTGK